jgi:hypothetical protein
MVWQHAKREEVAARRREQAEERLDTSIEPADYQAVGMQLRESASSRSSRLSGVG